MLIQRPKGTQDITPDGIETWHFLESNIRKVCSDFGFEEIRTPIFESTELFQRGVGDTTDIVSKEMYTFLDKGQRSITLRPEGTASVCRAYVENKMYSAAQPIKLYYIGPMFRYENTQAGRFRQFHQFGAEVLGGQDPLVDAEVIQLIWEFFSRIGIKGLQVSINSVGCPVCRPPHRDKLKEYLQERKGELCSDCQSRFDRNPMRILDCKNKTCQDITKNAPTTLDTLCPECTEHFTLLQEYLNISEIQYYINPKMVRGLDYYQRTAFEVMTEGIGAQSAICGGGRYDGLVEEIGGPATPGIGFAMGIERILTVMKNQNIDCTIDKSYDVLIAALGASAKTTGFRLMNQMRRAGITILMDLMNRGLKGQLKYADRLGIGTVLILGENEIANHQIVLRNMSTGEQQEIPQDEIIQYLLHDKKSFSNQI